MSAPTQAQIKAAFDSFDADKSGKINTQELHGVLTQCGVNVSADQCGQLIKMFDADGSGQMEFNEFCKLVEEALKH